MAAGRFNLTRRAVLGASVGVPIAALGQSLAGCPVSGAAALGGTSSPFGLSSSKPVLSGVEGPCPSCGAVEDKAGPFDPAQDRLRSFDRLRTGEAQPERDQGAARAKARWTRTLAAYYRAEARVAHFKTAEALLPAERRGFPACSDLEEEFGRLDSLRLAALRRLFRLPAPDVAALALKLRLAVADLAWELSGCETCLAAMADDAHRLSANAPA